MNFKEANYFNENMETDPLEKEIQNIEYFLQNFLSHVAAFKKDCISKEKNMKEKVHVLQMLTNKLESRSKIMKKDEMVFREAKINLDKATERINAEKENILASVKFIGVSL